MQFPTLRENIYYSFKQNLVPGAILQLFAIIVVVSYYYWQASHEIFNVISVLKLSYGWKFSLVSTAIFGGLIPYIYLSSFKLIYNNSWKVFVFYIIFWAYKGVEVDIFYTLQNTWFGQQNNFTTILLKTSVDQFIYSAFWAIPTLMICVLWVDSGFNILLTKKGINKKLFFIKIPTVIISNWLVWLPAVSIIYTMPETLQLPLFNLVLCFFVILIASLTKPTSSEQIKTH